MQKRAKELIRGLVTQSKTCWCHLSQPAPRRQAGDAPLSSLATVTSGSPHSPHGPGNLPLQRTVRETTLTSHTPMGTGLSAEGEQGTAGSPGSPRKPKQSLQGNRLHVGLPLSWTQDCCPLLEVVVGPPHAGVPVLPRRGGSGTQEGFGPLPCTLTHSEGEAHCSRRQPEPQH